MGLTWRVVYRHTRRHHVFANLLRDPLVGAWIGNRLLFALFYRTFRHFNGLGCLHMHGLGALAGPSTATPGRPLSLWHVVSTSGIYIADRLYRLVENSVLIGVV